MCTNHRDIVNIYFVVDKTGNGHIRLRYDNVIKHAF